MRNDGAKGLDGATLRPKKSSRPSSAVVAVLLLGFGAAPAAAAEEFAPHVQKAQACYDNKDYDCAVRELQTAYDIKHVPGLLLNIGHAHLDAGRPQEALTFYGMYLQSEKKLTPGIRAEVEKFRAQAKERMKQAATQPPTPSPTPTPAVDPLPSPTPTADPVPTGTPEPAAPTANPEPPFVVTTTPLTAPNPPAVRSSRPPGGALALIGVGAGLLIVGGGLGGGAIATAGQVTSGSGTFDSELDNKGRTLSYAGAAFDVLGAVALGSGIGWTISWAAGRNKDKAPATVSVRPSGAGAAVLGRF